jgi:hypothetical protein
MTLEGSYISSCVNSCIVISNTGFVASGDFGFQNSTIIPASTAGSGILIDAGSGLRLIGGKVLGVGSAPAILYSPSVAGAYSDLLIWGVSIENNGPAVKLSKGSSTNLTNVQIVGVENSASGSGGTLVDASDTTAGWLTGLNITGNTFDMLAINMTGIKLGASVKGCLVSSNNFKSTNASTGLTGVTTTVGVTDCVISATNQFEGIATPITNASVTTQAINTVGGHFGYVGVAPGAPTACGTSPSTAAGSTDNVGTFTTGSTATTSCVITFANAYTVAPRCLCSNSGGGQQCAAATTTTTQMTVSYASATSQTYNWQCFGN